MVNERNQGGFTVVELVAAIAVVGVLATALVQTGFGRTRAVADAFHETLAGRCCQAEIERGRTEPEQLTVGERAFALPASADALPSGHGVRIVREVEPGLLEIDVRVAWRAAGAARDRSTRLVTRVAVGGVR